MPVTRRAKRWLAAGLVVLALVWAAPSLWAFYLYRSFPDYAYERVARWQEEATLGKECSVHGPDAQNVNRATLGACFAQARLVENRTGVSLSERSDGYLALVHRCDGDGFAAEIVHYFNVTSDLYVCSAQLAATESDLTPYRLGDIAGYANDTRPLTRLLIALFP